MRFLLLLFLLATIAQAARRCPRYKWVVFIDTARNSRGLDRTISNYRAALGGSDNGNNPGPLPNGHRSINWDAGAVPFDMPGDFFDATVPRGAVLSTKTGEFRVSNPVDQGIVDDRFNSILPNSAYSKFQRFSLFRLFTPLNSNKMTMTYRIPGGGGKATVTGFGAIFTDVNKRRKTSLTYYDKRGCRITKLYAPPKSRGLSFVGLIVMDPRTDRTLPAVAKVNFQFGDISVWKFAQLSKRKRRVSGDVVVADDFIYGEPQKW